MDRIARRCQAKLLVLPCSESSKSMENALAICEAARAANLPRSGVLVAISGGVASDLVTMAASMLRRGVAHVRVPTTLLGLVDAALGVKGAVNFGAGKNSLGCFHAPSEVLLCPRFLETLPARHLRSGLGEVLKAAMAVDVELLELLERVAPEWLAGSRTATDEQVGQLLWRSAERMLDELEPNLFEDRTFVRKMDFAHTFGPLLESRSGHRLAHGESVAIDALFSSYLAFELGWLAESELQRIVRLVENLELVSYDDALDLELCHEALDEAMRHRGDRLLLFLPCGAGEVRLWADRRALDDRCLGRALDAWRHRHGPKDSLTNLRA